jgi:hypothetical protein
MIPVMSEAHCVRDIGAGGVSDNTSGDGAHRTSDQHTGDGAHRAVSEPLLRYRARRGESNAGGNYRSQQGFHGVPPSNEDVI